MSSSDQTPPTLPREFRDAVERTAAELFVGRARELAQLNAALKEAISGRGRLFLIAGEPGIGKTRLAECVAAGATERGATVVWGRCWEGEGAPAFWPWVQVLRACMRECDAPTLAARMGIGAPYIAQVVPEVREFRPDLPAVPPLDSEQARFRLYDACATFLKSTAGERPLVVILDDLHWADTSSLLLLQFLAREIADACVFVLGTYRDVEVSRGHPLGEMLPRLRRERTVDRVLLRGLPDEEVHAMLAQWRGAEVPESFAHAISHETGGNPFFIKEIVRHLLDEGIAYREGDRWVGRVEGSEIQLPESVREVIGRRLARLGDECATLLTRAAVIGHEFGTDILLPVSELEYERLLEVLEEALAARVIDEVPHAIGRYRFAHTLIRETLYGELRTLERIRLHRRVAEVLQSVHVRDPGPHLSELAHHFLESLPGGDVTLAVDYAVRAGDRDAEQLAYEEAAMRYERALQALELREPPDERLRCAILMKLGEARWSAGRVDARKTFRQAAELAARLGDAELLARGALGSAGPRVGLHTSPADENQIALLERALAALEERDSALRAQVMARLVAFRTLTARGEGTASLACAAIAMARRVGDRAALAYVLNATPLAAWGPDNLEERVVHIEELIRLADEIGDARLAAEGHLWKAFYHLEIGDVAGADRETQIQERFAETSRQAYHRWLAGVNQGAWALIEGRFEQAESLARVAIEIGAALHPADNSPTAGQGFVNALRDQQGRIDELIPPMVSLAARYPDAPVWGVAMAAYRAALKQPEEARRVLEPLAAADFTDIPRNLMWLHTMSRLGDVVSFLGDARRAAILLDLLLPYADRCVAISHTWRGSVSRWLGLLATVLSRYDDAEKYFDKALEMNLRIRARIWVAHTQHDYARMLVARDRPGDRERAATLAAEALATAREVGMKPLEANVLELQAAAGFYAGERLEPAPDTRPMSPPPATFRRDGDFWTIAYEGKRLQVKDAKGLQYIAHLLRHEGREFHAAELAAGADGVTPHEVEGDVATGLGDTGEVLDAQARSDYRQRLEDLRSELEEATRWGDSGRAARLSEEIDFLTEELSAAYGVGGRVRKAGDVANRARKAVTSRIRETIARIGKEHAALGRHLENAIRTGIFCSYQPDRSPDWSL